MTGVKLGLQLFVHYPKSENPLLPNIRSVNRNSLPPPLSLEPFVTTVYMKVQARNKYQHTKNVILHPKLSDFIYMM